MKKILIVIIFIFSFSTISLSENFNLKKIASFAKPWGSTFINDSELLLSGTQALVQATLIQKERDEFLGLNTAGYITGYRGSPLGSVYQ